MSKLQEYKQTITQMDGMIRSLNRTLEQEFCSQLEDQLATFNFNPQSLPDLDCRCRETREYYQSQGKCRALYDVLSETRENGFLRTMICLTTMIGRINLAEKNDARSVFVGVCPDYDGVELRMARNTIYQEAEFYFGYRDEAQNLLKNIEGLLPEETKAVWG